MEITKSRAVTSKSDLKALSKKVPTRPTLSLHNWMAKKEPQSWYMNFNGRKEPEVKNEATTM
jgi:hypothetical protein